MWTCTTGKHSADSLHVPMAVIDFAETETVRMLTLTSSAPLKMNQICL